MLLTSTGKHGIMIAQNSGKCHKTALLRKTEDQAMPSLITLLQNNSSLSVQTERLLACNEKTREQGLVLSEEDVRLVLTERGESLRRSGRIEFGDGIAAAVIEAFYTSPYITQVHYAETLSALIALYDTFKNEMSDLFDDRELLTFMRRAFDRECEGSLELLETKVFPRLLTGDPDDEETPIAVQTARKREQLRKIMLEEDREKDGKTYDTVPEQWEDRDGHILL